MAPFIMSLDAGTTSTRVILFDVARDCEVISPENQIKHSPIKSNSGTIVEFDPKVLLDAAIQAINDCAAVAKRMNIFHNVKVLGVTNQRETLVVWNAKTGEPYCNAIVWFDSRTAKKCAEMRADENTRNKVQKISGLLPSSYFTATKLRWIQDNCEAFREGIAKKEALFGTVDTWLVWNLTNRAVHATDVTNAGRTMLMDNRTLQWSSELWGIFGIDPDLFEHGMPDIRPSSSDFGKLAITDFKDLPIGAVIGDQHAALVGHNCLKPGEGKTTYGTGAFFITNVGTERKESEKLLATIAYQVEGQPPVYALEGPMATCGTAFEFLAQTDRLPSEPSDPTKPLEDQIDPIAREAGTSGGLVMVPALTGLLAPYWCENARMLTMREFGTLVNGNYVYAMMEGIALQVTAVMRTAAQDMGMSIKEHRVDGGASKNDLMMQIQADLSGEKVFRSKNHETTALGAALLAGLQVGVYKSVDEFEATGAHLPPFEPKMEEKERLRMIELHEYAVQLVINDAARMSAEAEDR